MPASTRTASCGSAPALVIRRSPASVLLDRLIRGLGMPRSLGEVGVSENQLPLIAEYTLEDIWGRTNPRPIRTAADVMDILRTAIV